jgi:hypothetical protein
VINLEYLWLLLLILPFAVFIQIKKESKRIILPTRIQLSQSRLVVLMNDLLAFYTKQFLPKKIETQATEYFDKKHAKVFVIDDLAYWIQENALYCADFVDGEVEPETKKRVDTFALDDVQLKKMSFIVDTLTEGIENEGRGSGNQ